MHPIISRLRGLDDALALRGFPRITEWWLDTLTAFYESGARQGVFRVGRRGGKSSTMAKAVVCEALYGGHEIAPGDTGVVCFISVDRQEASQRLKMIRAILTALGVAFRPVDGGVELTDRPIVFRVHTASLSGVVGFTAVAIVCDEVARWKDADTGANPATEVLGSLRPTMAGTRAHMFLASAPLGDDDAHARAFNEGTTDFQYVASAPTWVARPTLTEAETHLLEPDERVWAREYATRPQGSAVGAFDAELVDLAHHDLPFRYTDCTHAICVVDPSDMDGPDACEYAGGIAVWVSRRFRDGDQYVYEEVRDEQGHYRGRYPKRDAAGNFLRPPDYETFGVPILMIHRVWGARGWLDDIHDHIARECAGRTSVVVGDQHGYAGNVAGLSRRGLQYIKRTWNAENKQQAFALLRRLLREGRLLLDPQAPDEDWQILRRQCLGMQETISNGALHYSPKSGVLADRLSVLVGAAMASLPSHEKDPPLFGGGSPMIEIPRRGRRTFGPGEIPQPSES